MFLPFSEEGGTNKHRDVKLKEIFDIFKGEGLDLNSAGFWGIEIVKRQREVDGNLTQHWEDIGKRWGVGKERVVQLVIEFGIDDL